MFFLSFSSAFAVYDCSEIILQKNVRCHCSGTLHGLLLLFLSLSEIFHLLFTLLHYQI